MYQADGSLKIDHELVGVVAAVWQWGHFTNQSVWSLNIRSRGPNLVQVVVEVTQPAVMGRTFPLLNVNYAGGEINDNEGNIWYFIVGDAGLEFHKG
jgi:hypothetical protein